MECESRECGPSEKTVELYSQDLQYKVLVNSCADLTLITECINAVQNICLGMSHIYGFSKAIMMTQDVVK